MISVIACLGLVLAGPSPARSPSGMVAYHGRWATPDEVIELEGRDDRLAAARAEYADRRAKAPATAEGQRTLARWSEEAGLKAEALAHLIAVTRIDPDDVDAQRKLGRRKVGGVWMSAGEVASIADEAKARSLADREWGPKIAAWRSGLTEPATRDAAAKSLAAIRDPRAVPSLRRSFGDGGTWEQAWAVRLLGPIDAPDSTRELAGISVAGLDEPIRASALARLIRRDPRGFVGLFIRWLREPVRYTPEPLATGAEVTAGLRVEGTSAIVERLYRAERTGGGQGGLLNFFPISPGRAAPTSDADRARAAVVARRQADIREIDRANLALELRNERIERALIRTTGMDLGQDPTAWSSWWTDENGYKFQSAGSPAKPVYNETVSVAYTSPPPVPPAPVQQVVTGVRHACFAAGTPVLSRTGLRPIETLEVGDQVLTLETATGEVEFRPILAVFHNRPAATLRIHLGEDAITATPIHRFWLAGKGWAMARDLKAGDRVRTLGGPVPVASVAASSVQPVFNLEVADGHNFFVGHGRALVHDNSIAAPISRPFDAGDR